MSVHNPYQFHYLTFLPHGEETQPKVKAAKTRPGILKGKIADMAKYGHGSRTDASEDRAFVAKTPEHDYKESL